ncbi:O-methyltransferase [Chitinophaga skermanii]|uniref:O-methyltransferase n=1 Tax=Chitinophaga skermanii TaxID=331697 RepID=A0A327QZL1_9BACT|nr:class I SAM-dependent methyltransferase [Chitinophaga skermanii]RAJ08883.1 O-methyltransferase [Chitinophaga skermanii]
MHTLNNRSVQDTLQRLHQLFREQFEKRSKESSTNLDAYTSVSEDEGKLLYFLADYAQAQNIVEFGGSFGISTIYLAAAAQNNGGMVTTTEMEPNKVAAAQGNLMDAGLLEYVNILMGDALNTLHSAKSPIDFVFLDGAKELYMPVFNILRKKLSHRAVITAYNADAEFSGYFMNAKDNFTAVKLMEGRLLVAYYYE